MNTIQRLKNKSLFAKILFWTGEILGTVSILPLLLFVAGNVFDELIKGYITVKEEPLLLIFVFFLACILTGLIIAWFKCRTGALITIAASIAAGLAWGTGDITLLLIILIPLVSGILLLLSAYKKEEGH